MYAGLSKSWAVWHMSLLEAGRAEPCALLLQCLQLQLGVLQHLLLPGP